MHLNVKFRRKLVLEEMVQFVWVSCWQIWAFPKEVNDGTPSKSHREELVYRVEDYWELLLLWIFQNLWVGGCTLPASLGFVKSLREARSRSVSASIIAEWRSGKSLLSSFDKVTLPNSQLQFCWAFGEVGGSGLLTSNKEGNSFF